MVSKEGIRGESMRLLFFIGYRFLKVIQYLKGKLTEILFFIWSIFSIFLLLETRSINDFIYIVVVSIGLFAIYEITYFKGISICIGDIRAISIERLNVGAPLLKKKLAKLKEVTINKTNNEKVSLGWFDGGGREKGKEYVSIPIILETRKEKKPIGNLILEISASEIDLHYELSIPAAKFDLKTPTWEIEKRIYTEIIDYLKPKN